MRIARIPTVIVMLLGCLASFSAALRADERESAPRPKIQIAILLDTSSSMAGLIDQARAHLWSVVNQFIDADLGGQQPLLRVALLEYGAGRLSAEANYTRLVVPLTDNLDRVSEELMSLTAVGRPGGSLEYCGQIIDMAVHKLAWDESAKGLKCIFIAGNEAFTQGPIDFRKACLASAEKNVTVSTIFCGDHNEGIRLLWEEGANLADGTYFSINHNQVARAKPTPHDKALAELNTELNQTYLAYGNQQTRLSSTARQIQQDAAAARLAPNVLAERARFKGSSLYRNESWDLIDGVTSGRIKLADLKDDQLPESLRKMPPEKRGAHIKELTRRRAQLQTKITAISQQRDQYLATQREAKDAEPKAGLDDALIQAVREQAAKQDIKLKDSNEKGSTKRHQQQQDR